MKAGTAGDRLSAGLLLVRRRTELEVLLGHMGGPFWARKDEGAWSAPKGLVEAGERDVDAAEREFQEETGLRPPSGARIPLGDVRQRSGKTVRLWAVAADLDLSGFIPQLFDLEWPRGSGRTLRVPEIDRIAWTPLSIASTRLVAGQRPFLARLADAVPAPQVRG